MRCEVILWIFAATLVFFSPGIQTAKASDKCDELLRHLQNNPPKNTNIAIDTQRNKARYACKKGFILVGNPELRCKKGRWIKKEQPKCLASAPCGKPEDIPHAKFVGSSFNFNDKLRYRCEKGYKLRGSKTRTCGKPNVGKWSKAPKCAIIRCNNAERVTMINGRVTTSDPEYVFGTTLAFECNDGYEINNPVIKVCTEFGWRPPLRRHKMPYCKEKSCPDPGTPENGDRSESLFTVGSVMRFSCQHGFDLHGSRERKCMENLEWDGSLTTCQDDLTDCPVLGTPISGRKYGSKYNVGDVVNFKCNDGFVLKGSAVRECFDNGTWTGTEAICKDLFKDVNTTAFILRKDVIDTLLEYTCNHENQTGCNKTNTHGRDTVERAINLNDEDGLDLMFVIDASSSVTRSGFKLSLNFSQELVRTIGMNKRRDGTRIALVTFGTEVKVEFNLQDAKVDTLEKAIEAIGNATYIGGATASALALQKVRKVVVTKARKDSKRAMIFITDGMSNIGGPPRKEAKNLREKEKIEIYAIGVGKHAKLLGITNDPKKVIHVRNYDILQKAVKKAVHMKIVINCGDPGTPRNGKQINVKNNYNYGGTVEFACDANYTLAGSREITCQQTKDWSSVRPYCLAPCPNPGVPGNGSAVGDNILHGGSVSFKCRSGFELEGDTAITCLDGTWSGSVPQCKVCREGKPLGMSNTTIIPHSSIRASSVKDDHLAHHGRLGGNSYWCSTANKVNYIEIDLPKKYKITKATVDVQASNNARNIDILTRILQKWILIHKDLTPLGLGKHEIVFSQPFISMNIRILVPRQNNKAASSVCLRAEVYGCKVIPRGCILPGTAVRTKVDGKCVSGRAGAIYRPTYLEFVHRQSSKTKSVIVNINDVVLHEKTDACDLTTPKPEFCPL